MKKLRKILGWGLAGCVIVAGLGLAWLIVPGTPSPAGSLRFVGFVPLPKKGVLNVLDYLTLDGDHLFVAGMFAGNVIRVPVHGDTLATASDLAVFAGTPGTHGVVVDPVSGQAFVSRSGANTVDVFDPVAMRSLGSIPVADDPDGIFYDPQNKLVYVAGGDSKTGTLIDPATRRVVGTLSLGGKPEFAVYDPKTRLIFQNLTDTNEVIALDLGQRGIVARWPLAGCQGPSGMAIDAGQRRLFVACAKNSRAAIFDLDAHRVVSTQPVGRGPDTIAYDPSLRRLYTIGFTGVLTVLRQEASGGWRVTDNIQTHFGAHTLCVDLATHRIYVGYAGFFVAPRLAVFDAVP